MRAGAVLAHQSELKIAPNPPPPRLPAVAALALFKCSARSKQAPSPIVVFSSATAFPLVGSWSRRGQSRHPVRARVCTGTVKGNHQSPRQFQSASSMQFPEVCAHFTSGALVSSALLLLPLIFKHLRGLVFPVSDPRAGVPNMWFESLAPQEDLQAHVIPLLFCVPS